jgi:hypothetical protein
MILFKQTVKLLILIVFTISCHAQTFELGKVTSAELSEKEHMLDKEAPAAVLFSIGKTRIEYSNSKGFELVTEVESKIKIYKKEGYEWANFKIPFYVGGSDRESVEINKAITYNLVDGKIEKTKLKSDGEFLEETNKFWNTKKVTMPMVKEGSIIEYKYAIRSPYLSNFPDWDFQKTIPVNYSKFTSSIPEYYVYNSRIKGYLNPKKTSTTKNTNYNYTVKERDNVSLRTGGSGMTSNSNRTITYLEEVTIFELENIPAMKEEDFVSNIKNYMTSVSYELAYNRFPNEPVKTFSVSWEDVTRTIYDSENFGGELKKTGYFENDLNSILSSLNTKEEKISAVFAYVRGKVKWDGYHGIYCDEGVKNAYKNNVGNVAEMNLMLTAMLRHAGLNANPVLVSTRSNGIPLFPSRTSFNYVICAIEEADGAILLDATDMNSSFNILPIRALNWEGRLIRKDGTSSSISLYPGMLSKENSLALLTIDKEGNLNGKMRTQLYDYNAYRFRDNYSKLDNEVYLESLEKKLSNIAIADYKVTNNKDLSKPILEEFSFASSDLIEIIGDKMYFSPLFFHTLNENPFKLDKRDFPVDFVYPYEKKYAFTIDIPEGYAVESLPKNAAFALDNNMVVYRYNLQAVGNKIQVSAIFSVNQSIIIPDYYPDLKDMFKQVVESQKEKVILKKG